MRPMRELWGSRILEGEAPRHCQQQQQLVSAVKLALQQGGSQKKLRRSIERWKRQTGAAWCDVEEVLRAGQQAVQKQQLEQQQQPPGQESKELNKQQLPVSQQFEQQGGNSAGSCRRQTTAAQSHDRATGGVQHQQNCTGQTAVSSDNGYNVCSTQHDSRPLSTVDCQLQHRKGSHLARQCPLASIHSHPIAANDASSQWDSPLPDAASKGTSAGSCIDNSRNTSSGGIAKPVTWTLEDLMALPADAVRPVSLEDLQWASSQAGHVDAPTDRYDEWTRKFGSGDGTNRGGRGDWRYLPMYM